jgi:hypothetical protein
MRVPLALSAVIAACRGVRVPLETFVCDRFAALADQSAGYGSGAAQCRRKAFIGRHVAASNI